MNENSRTTSFLFPLSLSFPSLFYENYVAGVEIKVYEADYDLEIVEHDGAAPIDKLLAKVKDVEDDLAFACINPIPGLVEAGQFARTSTSCEETLLEQAGLVHSEYVTCKNIVKETLARYVWLQVELVRPSA